MKEYTFSKLEIATYLRDFSKILMLSKLEQNKTFAEITKALLIKENRQQCFSADYFEDMIDILHIFLTSKILSLSKDCFFDSLKEKDLSHIDWGSIFVDKKDYKRFSKKQIINYIRNALAHNKSFRELYQIKRFDDDIKVEIELLNTKPIPFHVIIDEKILVEIIEVLSKAGKIIAVSIKSKRPLNTSISTIYREVLSNLYYRVFHFKTDEANTLIAKILNKSNKFLTDELIEKGASFTDYSYNSDQAAIIEEDLKYCSKWLLIDDSIIYEICRNALVPSRANEIYLVYQVFDEYFIDKFNNYKNSYNDVVNKIKISTNDDVLDQIIRTKFLMFTVNDSHIYNFFNLYTQFMFDSLITDQEINIGKYKLSIDKMRNSLVHSRWHCGVRGKMHFYDWDNGSENELKPNWKTTFKLQDYLTIMEEQYLKYKGNETIIPDYPIHFRKIKKLDENRIIDISFLKDCKGFQYIIDDEYLNIHNRQKGLYISDGGEYKLTTNIEELQMFLTEMDNLTEEEKEQNSQLIAQIKQDINDQINNLSKLNTNL